MIIFTYVIIWCMIKIQICRGCDTYMKILQNIKVYDGIFIFAIIFFFTVTLWVNFAGGKNFTQKKNNDIDDAILKDAYYRRKIWIRSSITWLAVHYFIVLSTFLSTSIVIYVSMSDEGKGKILFYSIVSFFSSIITYIVNPYKTSLAYRKAYMLIDFALLNNENIQESIKNGEKIIYKGHK